MQDFLNVEQVHLSHSHVCILGNTLSINFNCTNMSIRQWKICKCRSCPCRTALFHGMSLSDRCLSTLPTPTPTHPMTSHYTLPLHTIFNSTVFFIKYLFYLWITVFTIPYVLHVCYDEVVWSSEIENRDFIRWIRYSRGGQLFAVERKFYNGWSLLHLQCNFRKTK